MCTLRVGGQGFDPDRFLANSQLSAARVWRAGEARGREGVQAESGMNIGVSDAPFSMLDQQIEDAERFMAQHSAELNVLMGMAGVSATLDFGVELRLGPSVAAQCDHFPASLVKLAASFGFSIELTLYPAQ